MCGGVQADGDHAGGAGGANAAGTVLDHNAVGGCCVQFLRGEQEDVGRGLAVGYQIGAVDMSAEIFGQAQCIEA